MNITRQINLTLVQCFDLGISAGTTCKIGQRRQIDPAPCARRLNRVAATSTRETGGP